MPQMVGVRRLSQELLAGQVLCRLPLEPRRAPLPAKSPRVQPLSPPLSPHQLCPLPLVLLLAQVLLQLQCLRAWLGRACLPSQRVPQKTRRRKCLALGMKICEPSLM